MTLSTVLRCITLAAACGVAAGCAANESRDAPAAAPRTRIRLAFSPHGSWSPIIIANAAGDFEAEGLDIEFVTAMRSEESLVAVITGDLDVRPGPITTGLLSAVARGAPIRIVAGMGVLDPAGCTYFGLVVRPGIDTSGVVELRRIRASDDGAGRYVVHEMLRKRGLSLADIETVRLPEAVTFGALRDGAVDAVAVTEHALSRITTAGTLWLAAEDAVPGFQWGVIMFSERMWQREPELGTRFLRAYRRGILRYNAGKTESNVRAIAQMTGETPEQLRRSCWLTMPHHARIHWPSIDAFQRWAVTEGLLQQLVPASAVWDSAFVAASDSVVVR